MFTFLIYLSFVNRYYDISAAMSLKIVNVNKTVSAIYHNNIVLMYYNI